MRLLVLSLGMMVHSLAMKCGESRRRPWWWLIQAIITASQRQEPECQAEHHSVPCICSSRQSHKPHYHPHSKCRPSAAPDRNAVEVQKGAPDLLRRLRTDMRLLQVIRCKWSSTMPVLSGDKEGEAAATFCSASIALTRVTAGRLFVIPGRWCTPSTTSFALPSYRFLCSGYAFRHYTKTWDYYVWMFEALT